MIPALHHGGVLRPNPRSLYRAHANYTFYTYICITSRKASYAYIRILCILVYVRFPHFLPVVLLSLALSLVFVASRVFFLLSSIYHLDSVSAP
jgi:hypothetical protein